MRGVLPEAIRTRIGKADFTHLVNEGVVQDAPLLNRTLSASSRAVRLGYLDPRRLPVAPGPGELAPGADARHSWDVADLFALETWLDVFVTDSAREDSAA